MNAGHSAAAIGCLRQSCHSQNDGKQRDQHTIHHDVWIKELFD